MYTCWDPAVWCSQPQTNRAVNVSTKLQCQANALTTTSESPSSSAYKSFVVVSLSFTVEHLPDLILISFKYGACENCGQSIGLTAISKNTLAENYVQT
eukprot:sb/3478834/